MKATCTSPSVETLMEVVTGPGPLPLAAMAAPDTPFATGLPNLQTRPAIKSGGFVSGVQSLNCRLHSSRAPNVTPQY